jgi:hypothetical protein
MRNRFKRDSIVVYDGEPGTVDQLRKEPEQGFDAGCRSGDSFACAAGLAIVENIMKKDLTGYTKRSPPNFNLVSGCFSPASRRGVKIGPICASADDSCKVRR